MFDSSLSAQVNTRTIGPHLIFWRNKIIDVNRLIYASPCREWSNVKQEHFPAISLKLDNVSEWTFSFNTEQERDKALKELFDLAQKKN